MSLNKARRGFLKLLPALPIGAAVAAKQAALSMGLSGPLGASAMGLGQFPPSAGAFANEVSGNPWFVDALNSFNSAETIDNHRRHAISMARVLDADIAAMRSISPARAFQMQIDRCFDRSRREEKSNIDRLMKQWVDQNPAAALAQKVMS